MMAHERLDDYMFVVSKERKKKFNDYEYLKDTPTLRGTVMARSVPFKL